MRSAAVKTGQKLKVGIFGVGRMGQLHLETLLRLQNKAEVIAIGDHLESSRERAKRLCLSLDYDYASKCEFYSTPEDLLAGTRGQLDALVTAGRTDDRIATLRPIVEAHVPVLADKPMSNTVTECVDFIREVGDADSCNLIQIGFQRAFDPLTAAAKRWLTSGQIGELQQTNHLIQDKNPTGVGYQSPGFAADMAVHLVFEALLLHDFEMPKRVRAIKFAAPYYEDRAKEGASVVHGFLEWDNGVPAHLYGSRINHMGYDNGFSISATKGRVDVGEFVGDFGPIKAKLFTDMRLTEELTAEMTPNAYSPLEFVPDFYQRFYTAFLAQTESFLDDVATGSHRFRVTQSEGWQTMFLSAALDASSQRDGEVFELGDVHSIEDVAKLCEKYHIE